MSTQSTQQQQQLVGEAPGPGGEMLAGKVGEGVALGLSQGLNPSKSQLKKQRKQGKEKQQQQQQQQPSQHYQQRSVSQEYRKESSPVSEGISQQSSLEQRGQSLPEADKEKRDARAKPSESPILPTFPPAQMEYTPASTIGSKSNMEPPLLSPNEKARQMEARKEVERLEEKEREERIERSKREDLPSLARKEAELVQEATGAKGVQSSNVSKTISEEEKEIMAKRAADSEASLMGTVIDEEQERQRRIAEEYPTETQPIEKTKAMEEIERSRRVHSYAEKARQQLAAKWSAKLFPNAARPQLAESKLWTPSGLLRRESGSQIQKKVLPTSEPRYGQFVATTTKTTSTHLPSTISQTRSSSYPSTEITASSQHGISKTHVVETGAIVDYTQQSLAPGLPKVCKDTYRSQNRPRIVVHHTGLSGKWARSTETVELKEGVDY